MPPLPDADPLDLGEDGVDIARLGQTVAWGGLAALAMLVAVLAARSETGAQRIATALHGGSPPSRSAAPAGLPEAEKSEVARLAERVHALGADRDRLAARLEALERTIDATGSTRSSSPATPAGNERVIPGVLPMPGPRPTPVPPSPYEVARPTALPSGQPPVTEAAPVGGPVATETTDRGEEAADAESAIDLGTGTNLNELRALWRTVKAQHGGVLQGMWPLVAVRDGATGAAELRLVIGPVKDAATAARMCALIGLTGRLCQPGSFEGQRLALR